MTRTPMPYFDHLLAELAQNNAQLATSFGRHVHWGFWGDPAHQCVTDEDYAQAAERLTEQIVRLAKVNDGQKILDVGCGFGGTLAFLNERHGAMQLTGVNIDGRQLERARTQVSPANGNSVEFVEADACALPFASGGFDHVLAVEAIFHFPSRSDFFSEASRVLKPGGILTLSDFVPSPAFLPMAALASSSWFEKYNVFGHCDIRATFSRYRKLAEGAGFELAGERDITANTLPTYGYLGTFRLAPPLLIKLQRLPAALGLLRYELLSFRKI
jgi:ubiquinone/menaquinone biosynthesis C-methylase UbiE